jgi:flagellar hook-length control protein FliK
MTLLTSTAPAATLPGAGPDPVAAGPDAAAPAASAVAAALPLFAQLLNLTDADPAPAANADVDARPDPTAAPAATADDGAPGAPAADATAAMASMAATMLTLTLPPPAQSGPTAGADGSTAPRIDSINTSATLSGTSARLDLSAAGVAVMPVPSGAVTATDGSTPDTGAANGGTAAGSAANGGTAAGSAAPTAAAQAATPDQARLQASADSLAVLAAATTAPLRQAPPASQPPPAAAQAAQSFAFPPAPATGAARGADRTASRGTDGAGNPGADGASRTALAGAAADDGVPAVTRADPAPAAVNGSYTPSAPATAGGDSVKLAGTPEQWQQPLREALGERLQLQLQRNDDHAVIRLEPPNMGRVEISIRHTGGMLQVNLSANNSEVLRQLNSIGDSVRQDLSQRQFADVAVTVSAAPRGMLAGGDGNGRGQQGRQDDARSPGRALSDDSDAASTFAMLTERE